MNSFKVDVPHTTNNNIRQTGLGFTFWVLVTFFLFEYGRIHHFFSFLSTLRVPLLLTVAVVLVWVFCGNKKALRDPIIWVYIAFIGLAASTVTFAPNSYYVFQTTLSLTSYLLTATLPIIAFIDSPKKLGVIFRIWVVIHVFLAVHGLTSDGRGTGGFLSDENDLAIALNMAIPYAWFLSKSPASSKIARLSWLVSAFVLILGVVATESRGGFVGLVAVVAGLLFFSAQRLRNMLLVVVLGILLFAITPASYVDEVRSIFDTADSTRQERFYSWRQGWAMFMDNPILGVGAGNYPWTVHEYQLKSAEYDESTRLLGGRVAHSVYFTLLPELGLLGTALFVGIVVGLVRRLRRTKLIIANLGKTDPQLEEVSLMIRAMGLSILAFLVTGTFISVLYYPHFWFLVGYVVATHNIAQRAQAHTHIPELTYADIAEKASTTPHRSS